MRTTFGFIGGRRITKIFLQGFQNAGLKFESVKVFEPSADFDNIKIILNDDNIVIKQ